VSRAFSRFGDAVGYGIFRCADREKYRVLLRNR
jgi:hypothetical protein